MNIKKILKPGYEPGDGTMDGAQHVDCEWWHPMFGCDSLQMVVDNYRNLNTTHSYTRQQILDVFDQACLSEDGTVDEIYWRGLQAVLRLYGIPSNQTSLDFKENE